MDQEIKKPTYEEEVIKLLKRNLEYSKEIHRLTKKIKNYITLQKALSIFYLLIIVVPIILGAIYLPPLLRDVFKEYQSLLNLGAAENNTVQDVLKDSAGKIDLNKIDPKSLDTIKKLLCK